MKGDMLFWTLVALVALLILVGFLALLVQRFGHQVYTLVEPPLFKRIADAHGLDAGQRLLLLRLAQRQGLSNPALYFVSPSQLGKGMILLKAEDPRTARSAAGMVERLFGPSVHEGPRA